MIKNQKNLSKSAAFSIGASGAIIALVLLLQAAAGDRIYYFAFLFVCLSGLVVMPILLYLAARNRLFVLVSILWFHLMMAAVLIYFDQVYSPFTALWSALAVLSALYYGWRGFLASIGLFVLSASVYISLFNSALKPYRGDTPYYLVALIVVTTTILLSYVLVRIIMENQRKNDELLSSRQKEEAQLDKIYTLINSINDPVLTLSDDGNIISQNAASQSFFDTNESLEGRELNKLLALYDDSGKKISIKSLINKTKTSLIRDDLRVGNGDESVKLLVQISRIRGTFNSSEQGVVMILRDITKEKSLEEEKDEFISVVSHELRTPVAIAEGSLSNLLLMQSKNVEASKLRDASEAAHRQIIYLAQMINDLSTLSRAERGVGDEIESINVVDLLHELFNRYKPEADSKKLILNLDVQDKLPNVSTSRLYLEEILQNFITNSLKYTKKGSITISAIISDSRESIIFSVRDTGIGMAKSDLVHIFEKFYRSEDYRTRETSGTGLGLYVVQKLAHKLGIKVSVESRLNHGSSFSFEIPIEKIKGPAE